MGDMDRRDVIKGAAALGLASCCGAGGCKMISGKGDAAELDSDAYTIEGGKLKIELEKVARLHTLGGEVKITKGDIPEPIIVGYMGQQNFVAVSLKCPHGGREVELDGMTGSFRCVSFGQSEFALDGTRISGPAKKSLNSYETELTYKGDRQVSARGAVLTVKLK